MSALLQIFPHEPKAADALIQERLSQMESNLLTMRTRLVDSLDRELEFLRVLKSSLRPELDSAASLKKLLEQPQYADAPHASNSVKSVKVSNIVPMVPSPSTVDRFPVPEASTDPCLEKATVDELNHALEAAFKKVSDPQG